MQNGISYGQQHPEAREQSLTVLLVDEARDDGVVATLTLEFVANGTGALYPDPALAFVYRDWEFRQAEDWARNYVQRRGLWQKEWDVRWRLERRDRQPISALTGPSMGGAFALGLAKCCVSGEDNMDWNIVSDH